MSNVRLVKGFISNSDKIIELAEEELENFSSRGENSVYKFETKSGCANLSSLFHFNMSEKLKKEIFKDIPKLYSDDIGFCINRYLPGQYLPRHKDSQGSFWKFMLIFLRSDKPHFKYYDENNRGIVVDEEPGSLFEMPLNLEHEVTEIGPFERPKYSLALYWGI